MNMAEEQEVFLTPLENYLKVGLHIGTKFRTKYMAPFIYKVRPDGLAVLNVKKIDERIEIAAKFLAQYDTKDILVVCRRENGWAGAKLFHKLTGIPVIAGRYRPGLLTNPALEDFKEIKILFVPCNNKGKKSLGLMFYLLGKEYMKARGTIKSEEELSIPLEEFIKED